MKKCLYILFVFISMNIYGNNFRMSKWGMSVKDVIEKENSAYKIEKIKKSKIFLTHKGEYRYRYEYDKYIFEDVLNHLDKFQISYYFLNNRLIKSEYKQVLTEKVNNFKKMKKYLIIKYGNHYREFSNGNIFEWVTKDSVITLNLIPEKYFIVEYRTKNRDLLEYINSVESGKRFYKNIGSEMEDYKKIKNKI